jgi:REP element-mobilizing transposase RayT
MTYEKIDKLNEIIRKLYEEKYPDFSLIINLQNQIRILEMEELNDHIL